MIELKKIKESSIEANEKSGSLCKKINSVLYSVIFEDPVNINGIEIKCLIKPKMSFEDRKGRLYFGKERQNLRDYFELMKIPFKGEFSFMEKLPYAFSTGVHGSGERAAAANSRTYINFERTNTINYSFPAVLHIQTTSFQWDDGVLALPEIKQINLIKTEKFSKKISLPERELKERLNPTEYYLQFRGFVDYGDFSISRQDRSLFNMTKNIFSGFFVYKENGAKVLYEFTDYISMGISEIEICQELIPKRDNLKKYSGEDIIKRLSKIKPDRRF